MRKVIFYLSIVLIASACGPKKAPNKTEELKLLKTQLGELQNKIAQLEKEVEQENIKSGKSTFKFPVQLKTIQAETFNHYIEVNGVIEALKTAFISPEVSGQIKHIYVKEGDRVKKDQLLAKLNTSVIENSIKEVQTSLSLASTIFEKQQRLWDQKIGSEVEYLKAKNDKEALESKLESLKSQLDLYFVKAPFDGIIDDILQKKGEMGSPGMQIMSLINLKELYINADVSESYLPVLSKGSKVDLSFPDFPELDRKVPIHRIGNMIHSLNRTVNLQLKINNTKEKLKPNGLAVIRINDFSSDHAFVVPSIIVKQDINGSFLYLAVKENKRWVSKKKYIKTGVFYEDQIMVESGLNPNDKVIVKGYNQISDGSEIKF